jgi:hypothetical protein
VGGAGDIAIRGFLLSPHTTTPLGGTSKDNMEDTKTFDFTTYKPSKLIIF